MTTKFDPKTQTWVDIPDSNTPKSDSNSSGTSSSQKPSSTSPPKGSTGNTNSSTEPKPTKSATDTIPVQPTKSYGKSKDANKEYTYSELTYLTGDCNVEPNSVTLATEAGNTIELKNLGQYLSGLYFVTEVKLDLSTSGTTLTYSLLKNGFGKTLKPVIPVAENSLQTDTPVNVPVNVSPNICVGDKVGFIEGVEATYIYNDLALLPHLRERLRQYVIIPQWIREKTYTVKKITDDGKVLLKELDSWTYLKFLQKV